jgi:hypothetical protein
VIVGVIIILVAILGIFLIYSNDISSSNINQRTLNVSSEGPLKLSAVINDIKTNDYYDGYDNETVEWMESLGEKYVWSSLDELVIMNKWDSDKIPSQYVCDAYFNETFSCNVLEKHSLGSGDNFKDVLLVNNVEYIGEEIGYYDV